MVWSEKSTLGEIPFCFRRVSALGDFLRCSLAPLALLAGGTALDRSIDAILAALSQGPFIFNLGHGVLPETPVNMCVQLAQYSVSEYRGCADPRACLSPPILAATLYVCHRALLSRPSSLALRYQQRSHRFISANTISLMAQSAATRPFSTLPIWARSHYCFRTGFVCAVHEPPKGAIARALHAITLLIAHQMVRDFTWRESRCFHRTQSVPA